MSKQSEEIEQETQHPKQKEAVQGGIQPAKGSDSDDGIEQKTQHVEQKESMLPGYNHAPETNDPKADPKQSEV